VTDFGQAFGWKSYICRCGNMVPHNLSTKYCPGSYAEGPLWSDYLSTHHKHVHWANTAETRFSAAYAIRVLRTAAANAAKDNHSTD